MSLFKKKQEEDKNKPKKQKLSRVAANNVFALKIIRRAAPGFMVMYLGMTAVGAMLNFISGSYALRVAVNNFQAGKNARITIVFILTVAAVSFIYDVFTSFVWNIILPKKEVSISREIKRMMFNKAGDVELACYEDPAFFDKYVKAMDGAEQKVRQTIYTLNNLIWRIVSLFANSALLFTIDPVLMVFGLLPLLLGGVKKKKVKIDHDFETAVKPIDRRRNYVKRTFYLTDYAKEMRLTGIKSGCLLSLTKLRMIISSYRTTSVKNV